MGRIHYLTPQDLLKSVPRKDAFKADPDLVPGYRAELWDYKGSGLNRGHMAPCEDMSRDRLTEDESFYLSNMVPQNPNNNQQFWRMLEAAVNAYVKSHGPVYVITGPIYNNPQPATSKPVPPSIGPSHVAVPTALFKIVVRKLLNGKCEAVAIVVPNAPVDVGSGLGSALRLALTSVDQVEKYTGLNFLNALPIKEQDRIESEPATMIWFLDQYSFFHLVTFQPYCVT